MHRPWQVGQCTPEIKRLLLLLILNFGGTVLAYSLATRIHAGNYSGEVDDGANRGLKPHYIVLRCFWK